VRCLHCGGALTLLRNRGWVHVKPDGTPGGAYMMRCRRCGYTETSGQRSILCPNYSVMGGAKPDDWRDDHCALPDRRGEE